MNQCKACIPTILFYKILISGEENLSHLPQLQSYLESNGLLVNSRDNIIVVKEAAVAGLYDYFSDIMEVDKISFKVDGSVWRPIHEVVEMLEFQWIDKVILEKNITFHIQPIVTGNEQIFAYEMLARFQDVTGNSVAPYQVFTAAKKRNRTYALDRACRMSAVKTAATINQKVFINFIPTSIYSPEHCLRTTVQLANQLGIPFSRLVFEVVETETVADIEHLKKILTYYRKRGLQYALDDVGEGFSTIEVLEQLMPNYMKLDMKFVQGVSTDLIKQQAAKKFLLAALQVGAIPLAEGIEERVDFEWLKEIGYELFQGYLFGKPAPIPSDLNAL
ncbi:EAL domain-containing protein [Sporosarcina sp. ANT_H38]|uniref:EAL domain-containing protein n=1 Tax=Sporosarcina sp. ANT_H38 TaxID=2597358 RepID=UPI0011F12CE4|nr:EAL domain-containing protein [Sporosarcina sp. ANT_H38]KAA0966038.1 EAL domain-containing protein [Sporosarcina sp. ANT_H38]